LQRKLEFLETTPFQRFSETVSLIFLSNFRGFVNLKFKSKNLKKENFFNFCKMNFLKNFPFSLYIY